MMMHDDDDDDDDDDVHSFIESRRKKVIMGKEKVHEFLTNKMLFAMKLSNYFYGRKAAETFYSG